jgi:hypothetical protein
MPRQALSTAVSDVATTATRFALAVTKALASPSIDSEATDEGPPLNSLQPERAAWTLATALSAAVHPLFAKPSAMTGPATRMARV